MDATQQLMLPKQLDQAAKMQGYYRIHAKIYDYTRWTFLFGRKWLLDWLPFSRKDSPVILEVGCGTGHNLKYMADNLPKAQLIGVDLSAEMLDRADKKLMSTPNLFILKQRAYSEQAMIFMKKPDCILFSYCLTMVNPNWKNLILEAKKDLHTEGVLAIVDFHQSKIAWFRRWMQFNHVRMEGHILPFLEEHFETIKLEKRWAYFGLWRYFLYIGKIKQ